MRYRVIKEMPFAKVGKTYEYDEYGDLNVSHTSAEWFTGEELKTLIKDGWNSLSFLMDMDLMNERIKYSKT